MGLAYSHLVTFAARNGDARVPQRFVTDCGYPLGLWVAMQRQRKTVGKMSARRAEKLESLHNWAWSVTENVAE